MVLMLLLKMQSVLRVLLPKPCFRLLHALAYRGYEVWVKTSDEINYLLSYVYYVCTRDSEKATRIKTIRSIKPYSLVGISGLLATYDIATEIEKNNIEGCFVECGVARGGCSALMAIVAARNTSDRKMWLFDSFEGLPGTTIEDEPKDCGLTKGSCLGTYDEVSKLLFSKLGLDRDNVFMVKGWFQDTLPNHKDKIGKISLLRIDADWYESTKCCLENLYDNVITGGYIYVDDYHLAGCKKAIGEFLQKKGLDVKFTFDDRGGAYFVKPY